MILVIIALGSSSCNLAPAGTPTFTLIPPTRTSAPSSTPAPTITPPPTETPLPSITPSPSYTPFPTPETDFSKVRFFTAGFLDGWRFFFALQSEKNFIGNYRAMVDGSVEYTCEILASYPNRLYCSGPLRRMNDWVDYQIFQVGSDQAVFSGRIFIPLIDSLNRFLR